MILGASKHKSGLGGTAEDGAVEQANSGVLTTRSGVLTRTVRSSDYKVRSFDKEVRSRVAQSAVVQVDNNRSYSE